MTPIESLREDELQAYVDGALDADAAASVEAWLAEHPEDAAKAAAYKAQNDALRDSFDSVLDEDLPASLRRAVQTAPRAALPWRQIAAGIALLLIGGGAGWALRDAVIGEASVAEKAISAHYVYVKEKRHAVEVQAAEETHLVRWLSNRLGQPIKAPSLLAQGYRLVGGRLLPDEGRPAAQFMYENEAGSRLTVYARRSGGGAPSEFQFVSDRGVSAFYWIDADFAYVLSGTIDRPGLLDVAKVIHRDLGAKAR